MGAGNMMTSTTKYRKIDRNGTARRIGRFFLNAANRLTPATSRIIIKGITWGITSFSCFESLLIEFHVTYHWLKALS